MNQKYVNLITAAFFSITGCYHFVDPVPKMPFQKELTTQNVAQKVAGSIADLIKDDCDEVKIVKFNGELSKTEESKENNFKSDNLIVVCYDKIGKDYKQRFGINLSEICSVSIQERHFPPVLEYLWNDRLVIENQNGIVYSISLDDAKVEKLGSILKSDLASYETSCKNNFWMPEQEVEPQQIDWKQEEPKKEELKSELVVEPTVESPIASENKVLNEKNIPEMR